MMNRSFRNIFPAVTLLFAACASAATLSGTITNRTTDKPSGGDTVAIINTAQSMDEIAKTKSDAKGAFHVDVPDGGQILLHITHQGAEYFKAVPAGTNSTDIDVYDSAAKIDGVRGEAMVVRAETDPTGKMLTVAENFFVQNASTPPRTQYGSNTVDFYVPKGAQVGDAMASAPNGLPTSVKVKTVDAATGHYAFTFPVRPGETRFQVEYTLPYTGRQAFSLKLGLPTGDVAIMVPKTMQFEGPAFQAINDPDVKAQSYDDHQPLFAQPIEFTLSGAGQLPQEAPQNGQTGGAQTSGEAQTAGGERPGGGLGVPVDPGDTNAPLSKYKWWIVGGLGLVLAAGAGFLLRQGSVATAAAGDGTAAAQSAYPGTSTSRGSEISSISAGATDRTALLQALKDEIFGLETDRLAGRITQQQYDEHKAAFDVVLRRALSRTEL
jgi:hypothetical protein